MVKKGIYLLSVLFIVVCFQNCTPLLKPLLLSQNSYAKTYSGKNSEIVWESDNWLRDPSLLVIKSGKVIMSGTRPYIVLFPDVDNMSPQSGSAYRIEIFSPNGQIRLRDKGFKAWGKKFFGTPKRGRMMLASLPRVSNFNVQANTDDRRSTYLFVPKESSPLIPGTNFPLHWKMSSNTPFTRGVYNVIPYYHGRLRTILHSDMRVDSSLATTCIVGQRFNKFKLKKQDRLFFNLCPGAKVSRTIDSTGWNRNRPLPSEVRHYDRGGLVEGAWTYKGDDNKYYLLYSAGDYAQNYGGYIARCKSPLGGCYKALNHNRTDARPFLVSESKNYENVGRPFPVTNQDGELVDLIFHARIKGEKKDSILRCKNFRPTILKDFFSNLDHPGCLFDNL